jgi:L-iditol 2-dehydrogenase
MKAMLLSKYKQLDLVEVDRPRVSSNEVLIAVEACGICGSDIHGFDGSSGRRIPPLIMGHEAAGTIAEVGSDVRGFSVGDRVTFDSMISCGICSSCQSGATNLCQDRRVMGVSCDTYRQAGAFAEFIAVPQHIVYSLPKNLPFEHAAMVEPVSVAVHAVSLLDLNGIQESAVVVGTGMIGLLVVQALRVVGFEKVIAVDVDPFKLNLASELGATQTVNANESDPTKTILELTDGQGVDVAMEVVGKTAPLQTAVESVRLGGQVGLVGNLQAVVDLPLQKVVTREIKLIGSCGSSGEYPRCIELMANGEIQVAPLISKIADLEEGPSYFDRLYASEPELMKVILKPGR